jgi:predicted nucleic acid-binding protein
MRVVSNTSPILNLAIIGRLTLLKDQFGTVHVPKAVQDELRLQEDRPGSESIRKALNDGWIVVTAVSNIGMRDVLRVELDGGESEAIALASETKAELILLDERDARRVTASLKMKTTGVLGILLKAYRMKAISATDLSHALEDLKTKAGFHLSAEIIAAVLRA